MSEESYPFTHDAEVRVGEFLSAVDRALSDAGLSQAERSNVADDLKAQITEMVGARLSERSQPKDRPANVEDVESVLAQLDPPQAYAPAREQEPADGGEAHPQPAADAAAGPSDAGACGHGRHPKHGRHGWWGKWRRHGAVAAAVRAAIAQSNPFATPPLSAFDERARRVVAHAKNEARRWKHNYIGTEHVLIGLTLEEGGLASIILKSLELDADRVRTELRKLAQEGAEPVTADLIPVTPRSQRSFRAAAGAARSLGSESIGTEHLLLGLIAVPDGLAARILIAGAGGLDKVKEEVLKTAATRRGGVRPPSAFTFWPAGTARSLALAGDVYTLLATGQETGGSRAIIELRSPVGSGGLPPRSVLRSDVTVYVLQGSLRVTAANRTVDVAVGGLVNIPRGMLHSIRNAGDSEGRAILVATPAGIEAMLAEAGAPVSDLSAVPKPEEDELQRLLTVGPKYGVEFHVAD